MPHPVAIPAYFSHSYRAADRAVNEFFVDVLYQAGFSLTVDPKSAVLSPAQLEMMMRDSACFIAVVTRRPEERPYRCSPFAVYEYGLAIQARKPRLLFIEHGVSGQPFMDVDRSYVFDRDGLDTFTVPADALRWLADAGAPYAGQSRRTLGEVGLLPATPEFTEIVPNVEELLEDAGYTPVRLDLTGRDAAAVASRLDRLDYVIAELGDPDRPQWVLPYLMGRFVPSIKVLRDRGDQEAADAALPALVRDRALMRASSPDRPVIRWTEPAALLGELALEINQLDRPRRRFRDAHDGKAYFRSLGRANGPVFISNAWADNALAGALARALQQYDIDFFHYQYRNTIPIAVAWQNRLLAKVDESRIFVALISPEYRKSEWCTKEMERAEELRRKGQLTLIPYFLERSPGLNLPVQGRGLELLSDEQRVDRIVDDLQRELELEAKLRRRPTAVIGGDHRPLRPDVAVVALSADHYRAIRERLDAAQEVIGTQAYPNRFSWATGTLESESKGRYRVVVALGSDSGAEAVTASVEAFEPGSVVLLGPAYQVGPRGRDADVVVGDRLFGFDSRDGRPVARLDATVEIDPAVPSAARGLGRSDGVVIVAPVACGNLGRTAGPQAIAPVADLYPEVAAVDPASAPAVRVLDQMRDSSRLVDFSAVWTLTAAGGDDRPTGGAAVVARIIATAWPRPPATDEPERSGDVGPPAA